MPGLLNMPLAERILRARNSRTGRIAAVALVVLVFDQVTKVIIQQFLDYGEKQVVIPGFFDLVHWQNTGAAWSMFSGNNAILAVIAVIALIILFLSRHHFGSHLPMGRFALGLIFGGIVGNLIDRVRVDHVIDFLYFYMYRRGGDIIDFPAFNVADSAICTGVALVFIITWTNEQPRPAPAAA
jgi:signal peptidase II